MEQLGLSGRVLARNTVYSLTANVLALVAGFLTIPFLLRRLGGQEFGLLALAWVLLGYSSVMDFGLSRAATRYAAYAWGRGEPGEVTDIVSTALTLQMLLGLSGALALILLTPGLMSHWLRIAPESLFRATYAFRVIGLVLPAMLVSNTLQGSLEAAQRFKPVAVVRFLVVSSGFLAPVAALAAGGDIRHAALAILGARVGLLIPLSLLYRATFSQSPSPFRIRVRVFRDLVSFGGWVTVSSLVGPLLISSDRWIVALAKGSAAVAHYAVPHEAVLRLYVIPASLMAVLFPAYSALGPTRHANAERFTTRGMKYLALTMGLSTLVLFLFARDILRIWVGDELAVQGTPILQVMLIGLLLHSVASVPGSLFYGIGMPHLTAVFQLVQLPFHLGLTWFLTQQAGFLGAALAWSVRAATDSIYHLVMAMHLGFVSVRSLREEHLVQSFVAIAVIGALGGVLLLGIDRTIMRVVAGLAIAVSFGAITWRQLLDHDERGLLLSVASDILRTGARKEGRAS